MAAGKMTVGLELYSYLIEKKINTGFVATGQVGITVTGKGIPLDAYKLRSCLWSSGNGCSRAKRKRYSNS